MRKKVGVISLGIFAVMMTACTTDPGETTTMGAATGGVLGAGLGAIVGNQTGSTGAGLVIGAVAGASAGAAVGNALEAQQQAVRTQDEAIERQDKLLKAQTSEIAELRAMKLDAGSQDSAAIDQRWNNRIETRNRLTPGTVRGSREYLRDMSSPGSAAARGLAPERQPVTNSLAPRSTTAAVREKTLTALAGTYEGSAEKVAQLEEEDSVPAMRQTAAEPESQNSRIIARSSVTHGAGAMGSDTAALSSDEPDMRASLNPSKETSVECKTASDEFGQSQRSYDNSQKLFHLRRALRLCPENPSYHNALGELYLKLSRTEDAKFEFREALRLNPDFEPAKQNLRSATTQTN